MKNGTGRYIVLNKIAANVMESRRGKRPDFVFASNGKALSRMNNRAWRKARDAAGLANLRVHDLKHTFGARLRRAGVRYEDHQQLLGQVVRGLNCLLTRLAGQNCIDSTILVREGEPSNICWRLSL